MDTRSQVEPFNIKGHWWLPGTQDRAAGELTYTEEELTLYLYGALEALVVRSELFWDTRIQDAPIIHGESLEGERITLCDCTHTNWKPGFTLPPEPTVVRWSKLSPRLVILGKNAWESQDRFTECQIELPLLAEWLSRTHFRPQIFEEGKRVTLDYTIPQDLQCRVDDLDLTVEFVNAVRPPSLPLGNNPTIQHFSYIKLTTSDPKDPAWFRSRVLEFAYLFSIVFDCPIQSKKLLLRRPGSADFCSVCYARRPYVPSEGTRFAPLIPFEHIRDDIGSLLNGWFGTSGAIKHARRMMVNSLGRPSEFMDLRFLPLAHVAEILTNQDEYANIIPRTNYRALRKNMLAGLPPDLPGELMESLRQSLGHANGRTFRRRLEQMLATMGGDLCSLFCVSPEDFVGGIVNTRNHFTHYGNDKGKLILQGADVHWGLAKLRLMLQIKLLLDAGVPSQVLCAGVKTNATLFVKRPVWQGRSETGTPFTGFEGED